MEVYHRGHGKFQKPDSLRDAQIRAGPAGDHIGGRSNPYKHCGDRYLTHKGVPTSGFQEQYAKAFAKTGHYLKYSVTVDGKTVLSGLQQEKAMVEADRLAHLHPKKETYYVLDDDRLKKTGHYETLEPKQGESLTNYLDRCGVNPGEGIPQGLLRKHSAMWFAEQEKKDKAQKTLSGHYRADQLKIGTKVEMEHTKNPMFAKKIAKDHLNEIPDYYTRLTKMESDYKKEVHVNKNRPDALKRRREHRRRKPFYHRRRR